MTKFVKNKNELKELIKNLNKEENTLRVYNVGYMAQFVSKDENNKKDKHECMYCGFVVDDSNDGDDEIGKKAFIEIEKEYLSRPCLNFEVDRAKETIKLHTSKNSTIRLFDFWNSAALSKEAVDYILANI